MRILELGNNDLIGKRFNGYDLHVYLMERGIEAEHLVLQKQSYDDSTTFTYGAIAADESFTRINFCW